MLQKYSASNSLGYLAQQLEQELQILQQRRPHRLHSELDVLPPLPAAAAAQEPDVKTTRLQPAFGNVSKRLLILLGSAPDAAGLVLRDESYQLACFQDI